ncbi:MULTISPECIES: hypothetical protein [Moorena]|nr:MULTISPECIES: hypothetical protein [Moorena]NEP69914.1 hypothetical protein [Moorena sp. SIO3A5]NER92237.1 hypothetical protein [Moorena sp. SIO3A2]
MLKGQDGRDDGDPQVCHPLKAGSIWIEHSKDLTIGSPCGFWFRGIQE